ncbi:ABC transporter substrate-binding protein [Aquabacterium sp.]|uniref:ABC transporter substrate-binding protein n=1 Tax=Aquabacterium sp. TaxID=1872578 RepID=UPI002D071537|nr:extracellular solute-binding protein [Aquabacterium sp.]HSW08305.1 extracellular solute-binding protein [Aquabacterium sp.]
MTTKIGIRGLMLVMLAAVACGAGAQPAKPKREAYQASVVNAGDIVPPRVVPPCRPGRCPFAGQQVTVLQVRSDKGGVLGELKEEFEAATGARLTLVQLTHQEFFPTFISDLTHRSGKYDAAIAGAWWLGELVAGNYIIPYDKYHQDPRFPAWDIDDVLPGPRALLRYGGKKYMVANDHDGQVLYYRRDLFDDPQHQAAFKQQYGYALAVPTTWARFRDAAEYFNGKDLNGDGAPDHGLSMHLKVGAQGMFHFMSFSAPFVIGPANPRHYWFDPQTMKPLIESPGHVRALKALVELVRFGPKDMLGWDLGKSWDHFLAGRAALSFTWGDLGALAQDKGSQVKGKVGTAHLPGSDEYYAIAQQRWIKTEAPNRVGNTTGGSWAGVISRDSKVPQATYYLLALMAHKAKSVVYATRGWDGIDAGRHYHFLPPDGSGQLDAYLKAGWHEADVRDYTKAYFEDFNNPLQLPYLRIPGAFSYWQALDVHLAEAAAGQLSPEAALKATAVDFEEITISLGRERQRRAYRDSLGL